MRFAAFTLCAFVAASAAAADTGWKQADQEWRQRAEQGLRKDNGWLTLAGRYVMKPGVNTFGTGKDNDIVFPEGLGAARMGTIDVDVGKVTVKLAPGLTMEQEGIPMTEKVMGTDPENRDWVQMGRASFHVIEHDGRYILRLADKESEVRKRFQGRVWYDLRDAYRVKAKFVPYDPPRRISIVNVIDEVSDEPSPGYIEFALNGKKHRLDAVGDDDGLFFVLRDATAGKTTYPPGRFLYVEKKPKPGETFMLDLNRIYNPPCAFSEYTTCPLPPKQNVLKARIEAGEKYPPRRAG
ncbi:MAG TPA: DUF1684 domain-containing protein [Usitatibacter sp.]|nr:DUF1684 domain-containing protein [Usitatibacter sp.]